MSGNDKQKEWIGFRDKNIHHIPFPYPWELTNTTAVKFFNKSINQLKKKVDLKKDVCGVMIETFQGWGAVYYPKSYMQALSKLCKENDIIRKMFSQ